MNHGKLTNYSRRYARVVRSLGRRVCVVFGGKKMNALLRPAFFVLLAWILTFCSVRAGTTVDTPGVNMGSNVRYTVHWDSGTDSVVVKTRVGTDTVGTTSVLDTLINHFEDGGASAGSGTFDVPISDSVGKNVFSYVRNTGNPGVFTVLGPFTGSGGADPVKDWVTVNVTNTYTYPIKVVIIKADNSALWTSSTLAVGANVTHAEDVTGLTSGPFRVALLVPAANTDGVWEVKELADGDTVPITDDLDTVSDTSTPTDIDPTPVPDPGTGGIPTGQGVNVPGGAQVSIWQEKTANTTDNERLDKTTYKQGVDKTEANLAKLGVKLDAIAAAVASGTPSESSPTGSPTALGTTATASPASSHFPTTPTFFSGSFSSVTTIGATFPAITIAGRTLPSHAFSINLHDYDTPVQLFRAVCAVALLIGFFLMCIRSARGASADQT